MLQIATGKLFTRDSGRTNYLRGTIYTNASFGGRGQEVPVANGRLLTSSSTWRGVKALAYEFTEQIELEPNGKLGMLLGSTAAPYTLDFATVCSFALNCICSPDYLLVQRLTTAQPGVSTGLPPGSFIKRTFDDDFRVADDEVAFLKAFTHQLIGLARLRFLGAMRAIRTYVTAIHRVADDLELAYTLLVASVESLAQEFDGHQADWESLDDKKRIPIDSALTDAPVEVAQGVRDAILSIEHVALSRRFREFTLAHVDPQFFRDETAGIIHPSAEPDLVECLRAAYTLRSNYIHSLKKLPQVLTLGSMFHEVLREPEGRFFTLTGLARLARHVIVNFVMRQETIDREPYEYFLERHGVGRFQLAPEYWVGSANGDLTTVGRDRLGGFLEQLASVLLREPDAKLTDLRDVLDQANQFIPGTKRDQRLPYMVLLMLYNWYVSAEDQVKLAPQVEKLLLQELEMPSSEILVALCLSGQTPEWSMEAHKEALDGVLRRRRNALVVPRVFEAALILDFAERARTSGDLHSFRESVSRAVEAFPGHRGLADLEGKLDNAHPLTWQAVLLPARAPQVEGTPQPWDSAASDPA